MLSIDVTDVNMKLQMRLINRHIILFIMDGCNRCEYKSTNKSNQQTHDIIHGGMKYECNQCDYRATTQSSYISHTVYT